MTTLTLYVREYCSLCEEMQGELLNYQSRYGFETVVEDVDASEELECLFGEKVPVLMGERGEICHYFLDPDALQRYFAAL